jgi:glutamyl-tRNA synthetase
MLNGNEINALFPGDLPGAEHWEERYPPRQLPPGAMVTRFCPSPTGFAHLGGVYAAILDKDLAEHSGGAYLIRIEDTDQARTVEGAREQFEVAFGYFGVDADESDRDGAYGPYTQSERQRIYLTYVRQLLLEGKAYPCFATKEELAAAAEEQRAEKVPTGYYGRWATWREAGDEQIRERLAAGTPYVVRFRSPGVPGRIGYTDLVRGRIEAEANRNDVVILKSSALPLRLPTYHFAHVVDDHLMRVTHVIRGDEWISSVPVHLQLFDAIGFEPIPYAHIAPLLKVDGSGKRKLSKRRDPEASVDFYIRGGYPSPAILYYLRGLLNGRLAEMPLEEALKTPLRLSQLRASGALVDLVKLTDLACDYVAALSSRRILEEVLSWADVHDVELAEAIRAQEDLVLRALDIERVGVENPRKDLCKWSDFREVYGMFLSGLFEPVGDPLDERFGELTPEAVRGMSKRLLLDYRDLTDEDAWFDQIRSAASSTGFAPSMKAYKQDPAAYAGSIREASQVIRVLLTGSTRSPAMHLIAHALGEDEVRRRLGAVLA